MPLASEGFIMVRLVGPFIICSLTFAKHSDDCAGGRYATCERRRGGSA